MVLLGLFRKTTVKRLMSMSMSSFHTSWTQDNEYKTRSKNVNRASTDRDEVACCCWFLWTISWNCCSNPNSWSVGTYTRSKHTHAHLHTHTLTGLLYTIRQQLGNVGAELFYRQGKGWLVLNCGDSNRHLNWMTFCRRNNKILNLYISDLLLHSC